MPILSIANQPFPMPHKRRDLPDNMAFHHQCIAIFRYMAATVVHSY